MSLKIKPGKSVGQIALGMHREQYEIIMGISEEVFRRTPEDPNLVVAYDDKLIHLTVNEELVIKSVIVFQPEKVELDGIQLLGRDLAEVETELAKTAFGFSRVDVGLWSATAGIVIIENEGIVDGVEILPRAPASDL